LITQPDVTLTDYALAGEAGLFSWLIYRGGAGRSLARWFSFFFQATALASLAGGTVHGFFLDERSIGQRLLWPVTLMAVGAAAMAAWAIGGQLQFSGDTARWISRAAIVEFALYAVAVMVGMQMFAAAIVNYLPAALFLLFAFVSGWILKRERRFALGAAAMILTLVAAAVQWARIPLWSGHLNHNAFYHLIQAAGLAMLFASARRLVEAQRC
jgi:hypothetical protein